MEVRPFQTASPVASSWYIPGKVPREPVDDVRSYYRRILPFYEIESVSRERLAFWTGLARAWRPRRILEIGAGFGRITAALSRRALAVGIDISLEMLAVAARRAAGSARVRFLAVDMRRPVFGAGFDLIVAPSDPFSHLTAMADRRRALRAVARQLSADGRFVVEGLYRRRRPVELASRHIRHVAGVLRIDERWVPVGANQLWHARYSYRDRRPGEQDRTLCAAFVARAWQPADVRRLFGSCGLRVEALWGDFDRRPFSRDAARLLIVARHRARFVQDPLGP